MKISISAADLKEAVSYANTAINRRYASPIMTGMLLEADGGQLRAFGATFEAHASVSVPADVYAPGKVLVSGEMIGSVVPKLRGKKPVSIELEDGALTIAQGALKFCIAEMPIAEYPTDLEEPLPLVGGINGQDLAELVHAVENSASTDPAVPVLCGIQVMVGADTLEAFATDKYRLAFSSAPWEPNGELAAAWVIPAEWLRSVAKTVAGDTQIHANAERIEIVSGHYRAGTQTIGGDYPKIRALFTNSSGIVVNVNRGELAEAADAVSVIAERNTPIKVTSEGNDELTLAAGTGTSHGNATVTAEAPEPFVTAFNPGFLANALRALGSETVKATFPRQQQKPVLFENGRNTRILLMPVRLPNQ